MLAAREVHTVDTELGTVLHLAIGHAAEHHKREHHIAHHRLAVEQGRTLEQHADFLAQLLALLAVHLGDVTAVIQDFALIGVKQAHEILDEHGLARARLADDEIGLAVIELAAHVKQHLTYPALFLKRFGYILNFNHLF